MKFPLFNEQMDIKYLIEDYIETRDLQEWVNNRFKDPFRVCIYSNFFELLPILTLPNGIQFYNSVDAINAPCEVSKDYYLSDIRQNDRVIDIGANVGCFSIPASKLTNFVYAIEPVMTNELRRNVDLNHANIHILEAGLGNGAKTEITWGGVTKSVDSFTFTQIKEICGGCTFLKCDCEGFEWFIQPEELEGIRRIEMELHNYNPSDNDPNTLIEYITSNFKTKLKSVNGAVLEEFTMKFKKRPKYKDLVILHAVRD